MRKIQSEKTKNNWVLFLISYDPCYFSKKSNTMSKSIRISQIIVLSLVIILVKLIESPCEAKQPYRFLLKDSYSTRPRLNKPGKHFDIVGVPFVI